MIMNYKESNLQSLSKNIKSLLDDENCNADEIYEVILLTVGESINSHRDKTDKSKSLRDKILNENAPMFRPFTSAVGTDTISFGSAEDEHSEYWYQYTRNE